MLFWMVLLTIFSSILVYTLYPRNDAVTMLDQPLARIAVNDFLTQHLAAEQAASLINKSSNGKTMSYVYWLNNGGTDDEPYNVPEELYNDFIPASYNFSTTYRPTTKVYCIYNGINLSDPQQNTHARLTTRCGITRGNETTSDFLVTYGTVPKEFGSYIKSLAPQALGRRLFLAEYTNDNVSRDSSGQNIVGSAATTRSFGGYSLKTNCGILKRDASYGDGYSDKRLDFDPDSDLFLDNTRFYTVRFPKAIKGPVEGNLVCITRLSVAYKTDEHNNLRVIYPFNYNVSSYEDEDIGN